jgi:hypothetical protein
LLVTVRVEPTEAVPLILGATVFTGEAKGTAALLLELTVVEPILFVFVTSHIIILPPSAVVTA